MIDSYNFKAGLSVMSGANGTWVNKANQGSSTVVRSVGKVLKQYNKGTKIGVLSGGFLLIRLVEKQLII